MNDDPDDEYIPSWNGQRTSTPDRLAKCTWWFLGFLILIVIALALGQAIQSARGSSFYPACLKPDGDWLHGATKKQCEKELGGKWYPKQKRNKR